MKNIGIGFLSRKLGLAWFGLYWLTKIHPDAWAAAIAIGFIVSVFLIVQGRLDAKRLESEWARYVLEQQTKNVPDKQADIHPFPPGKSTG